VSELAVQGSIAWLLWPILLTAPLPRSWSLAEVRFKLSLMSPVMGSLSRPGIILANEWYPNRETFQDDKG
jgi:hypothetical protein